jgi:hypothetical protein
VSGEVGEVGAGDAVPGALEDGAQPGQEREVRRQVGWGQGVEVVGEPAQRGLRLAAPHQRVVRRPGVLVAGPAP